MAAVAAPLYNSRLAKFHFTLNQDKLAVPLVKDRLCSSSELVGWRDVPDGAVQPPVIVVVHIALDQLPGFFERQWHIWSNALPLERTVDPASLKCVLTPSLSIMA